MPVAVALGAWLYERHLVLEDDDRAVDAAVSSRPSEFVELVRVAEETRASLGHGRLACEPGGRTGQRDGYGDHRDAARRAFAAPGR